MKLSNINLIYTGFLFLFLTACVSRKQLLLLNKNAKNSPIDSLSYQHNLLNYRIQPGDLVNIQVSSTSSSTIEIFNKEFGEATSVQGSEASIFLNSYAINKKGEINLPLIGTVFVQDLTTDEISKKVKEKLDEFVNFVTVNTKLTSFRVTILGEVKNPGMHLIYNTTANIIQAIGIAGDITDYGNRNKIKIVRKTPDGSTIALLDLGDQNIIKSEFYYLYPNDIIYVEPLKAKFIRVNAPAIQTTISILTVIFLVLNFTKK